MRQLTSPALVAALSALCATVGTASGAASCGDAASGASCMAPQAASCGDAAAAGIALLAVQWKRSLRAVDGPEDSRSEAHAEASSSVPHVPQVSASALGDLAAQAAALLTVPEAPVATVNVTASHEDSSYSLSAAGQGDGLNGVVPASIAEGGNENASSPPLSQEHFEPFGYPGAGLLLELHLPEVTLRALHSSARGSLAQFLLEVRGELGKGAQVQESRVSILGIHGRYKRFDTDGLFRMHSERTSHSEGPPHMNEEVVVRFEILPGWTSDPDPRQALNVLRKQLNEKESGLMVGPLSTVLMNATVTMSAPAGVASQPRMVEHRGMAHMSAMAWPIGISAAFIGILIWLAAY